MRRILTLLLFSVLAGRSQAQYDKIWMFGNAGMLDFSSAVPSVGGIPNMGGNPPSWEFQHAGAVCNSSGVLQFWVKLHQLTSNPGSAGYPNIFFANGQPMPNSDLMSNVSGDGVPLIVPQPGRTDVYYIFYIKKGGLYYSIVDMTSNGGQGGVVSTKKNILIGKINELVDQKLSAIPGCHGVWIACRARTSNRYISYLLDNNGVSKIPAYSEVGLLPLTYYGGSNLIGGLMKSSVDGRRMAVAAVTSYPGTSVGARGGLELYDIEKCSGRLYNPLVLDTIPYYGVCFSPDGSKLYATALFERRLYQFDLAQPSTASVIASKTLVLTNPYGSSQPDKFILGDVKRAINGRLYLSNNVCFSGSSQEAMHEIQFPNQPGILCGAVVNAISFPSPACPGLNLPADIVAVKMADTIESGSHLVSGCFKDSVAITHPGPVNCLRWNDSSFDNPRIIKKAGTYIRYYNDGGCTVHVDTFRVAYPMFPIEGPQAFSCPRAFNGGKQFYPSDSSELRFEWLNSTFNVIRSSVSKSGDKLEGLDTGAYYVRIKSEGGCDSVVRFVVKALPQPKAGFSMNEAACKNEDVQIRDTSFAAKVKYFLAFDTINSRNTVYQFDRTGEQRVVQIVGNAEGCSDTMEKTITVRDFSFQLLTDNELVDRGSAINIRSFAGEYYDVLSWEPAFKFPNQASVSQNLMVDTTIAVVVKAVSEYGCKDTATLAINVRPKVFMPTAFSPNGDGLNDRFRPVIIGAPAFVRYFRIYNRWGEIVYQQQGTSASEGWDGRFNNNQAEIGTYHYVIEIETSGVETFYQKGDVVLLR